MRRGLVAAVVLVMAGSAWSQEGDESIGGRYRAWLAMLSGDLQADGEILAGTSIDAESTLDFDQNVFHALDFWVNVPVIPILDRVTFSYWTGSIDEGTTLNQTINFGNSTFTAGTALDSELEFHVGTVMLESFVISPGVDELGVALGVQIGVKAFQIRGLVEAPALSLQEEDFGRGLMPVIGGRVLAQVTNWFRLEAEVHGLGGTYGKTSGSYIEGFVEAAFSPASNAFIGLGYKGVFVDIEDHRHEDFEINLNLTGFFLSAGVRF